MEHVTKPLTKEHVIKPLTKEHVNKPLTKEHPLLRLLLRERESVCVCWEGGGS